MNYVTEESNSAHYLPLETYMLSAWFFGSIKKGVFRISYFGEEICEFKKNISIMEDNFFN